MDLSIIIPCHNLENYITPLLDSLSQQNLYIYKVELIFVCDNCDDDTRGVIARYLDKLSQFHSIHIINSHVQSSGLARNVGLDIAQGRYIWFVDGDDWIINADAMAFCIKIMDDNNLAVLRFKYKYSDSFPYDHYVKIGADGGMLWQYCFRRADIEDLRFSAIRPNEDVQFITNFQLKNSDKLALTIDEYFYYYNFGREGSIVTSIIAAGGKINGLDE